MKENDPFSGRSWRLWKLEQRDYSHKRQSRKQGNGHQNKGGVSHQPVDDFRAFFVGRLHDSQSRKEEL